MDAHTPIDGTVVTADDEWFQIDFDGAIGELLRTPEDRLQLGDRVRVRGIALDLQGKALQVIRVR